MASKKPATKKPMPKPATKKGAKLPPSFKPFAPKGY